MSYVVILIFVWFLAAIIFGVQVKPPIPVVDMTEQQEQVLIQEHLRLLRTKYIIQGKPVKTKQELRQLNDTNKRLVEIYVELLSTHQKDMFFNV